jgi:hypothetical protein
MRLAELGRVPFHVLIHKVRDRISVRFKRFHIRPSSIVGIFILYQACQSCLDHGQEVKRVASTKFTTEKFKFRTNGFSCH